MLTEAARRYIARGWSVVPIPPRSKGPTFKGWPNLRITDPEQWFGEQDNIGLILGPASNLVCVDLDHPKALELAEHFLPQTGLICGRCERPRSHWFYRVTGAIENKKHKVKRQTIVEVLGEGNQVVVGPSVHPTGDLYDEPSGDPATVDGNELTAAVYSLFCAVLAEIGEPLPQMEQHGKASGSQDGTPGSDYDQRGDVRSLLVKHGWKPLFVSGDNEHWRRPGKDWGTSATLKDFKLFYCFTSSTVLEAYKCYGPFGLYAALEHGGDFKAAAAELRRQGYGKEQLDVDLSRITSSDEFRGRPSDTPQPVSSFPSDCLRPPGLLGEIIDWNLRTALWPQPELALAGALALLGVITGRKVQDKRRTRTNIYCLGLAASGAGKEHARIVNKEILLRAGAEKMLGPEGLASSAGMIQFVNSAKSILFQLDEIGRMLETMRDPKRSPHLYKIGTELMKLESSSNTMYKGDAYANQKQSVIINQPHCCIYGTSVPRGFWESLTEDNVSEGLLGRMFVFEAGQRYVTIADPEPLDVPESIIAGVKWWLDHPYGPGDMAENNPSPVVVRHTPEAERRMASHMAGICQHRATEDDTRAALWSRTTGKTAKLALLLACSRCTGADLEIDIEDVELAIRISNWLTRRMLWQAYRHVSHNDREMSVKRVLRLTEAKISRSELTRKTQWLDRRRREEILLELVDSGLLKTWQESHGKASVTWFEASS